MRRFLSVLALTLVTVLPAGSGAAECVVPELCEPPAARRYPSLARSIGITVDQAWIEENIERIHESFRPGCEAFGKCLSVRGNPVDFCRLLFTRELRGVCEVAYDMADDLRGWQQCRAVADIFSMNQNLAADRAWSELQACRADESGETPVPSPRVELDPASPAPGVEVDMMVRTFDPETGFPMYGLVTIDGVIKGPTFDRFRYVLRFTSESDELGRISMRAPQVVVSASPARGSGAPPFAPVTMTIDTSIPKTLLTLDPPPAEWTRGSNRVRVDARDEHSGEPLAGRILAPGRVLGHAGETIEIVLSDADPPCGSPAWFRPREPNRPDTSLPVPSCP